MATLDKWAKQIMAATQDDLFELQNLLRELVKCIGGPEASSDCVDGVALEAARLYLQDARQKVNFMVELQERGLSLQPKVIRTERPL